MRCGVAVSKFKLHSRVRVFATLNGVKAETGGEVTGVRLSDGMLFVLLDSGQQIVAHPKQCRLLRKKARRRIEAFYDDSGANWRPLEGSVAQDERVQFVEVRRRK